LEVQTAKSNLKKKSVFREYAEAAVIAIILALFIRTFVVQAFKIPSGSMEPTLLVGDHILVNKFLYGVKIPFMNKTLIPISEPKRNDVVVFIYPVDKSKDFIKRIIGLPGDEIEIVDNKIYINGEPFEDRYGYYPDLTRIWEEKPSIQQGKPVLDLLRCQKTTFLLWGITAITATTVDFGDLFPLTR